MAVDQGVGILEGIPLFQGLSADQLGGVAPLLRRRNLRAGTLLMLEDDPGETAYVILSGTLKVFLDAPDGTETILALRGSGSTASWSSTGGAATSRSTAATASRCWMRKLWRGAVSEPRSSPRRLC